MPQHIRSSPTFHHRITRTSGIELDPTKLISIFVYENFRRFSQGFAVSTIDLRDGLLLRRRHNMLDDFARIDDKSISIHKLSPEL